jgi:hypothetical protein
MQMGLYMQVTELCTPVLAISSIRGPFSKKGGKTGIASLG